MNKKPLISVIIPIYKIEDYIHKCIDSVINQVYTNLEIILVDDGSPDRCGEICDEYARVDNRIKVIHKENGGLSDARNVGIESATGSYITLLDSDDWVHNEYIEKLFELLKVKNADIAVCNFIKTYSEDIPLVKDKEVIYDFTNIEALRELTGKLSVQMVVAWGKLYKTELFEHIRYPLGKTHEDEFTTHKLLFKARRIVFTTESLLYYRQRRDSIMGAGFKLRNKIHAIQALEERAVFFENIGQDILKNETYRSLFRLYKSINENIDKFEDKKSQNDYLDSYKKYKIKLRRSKQPLHFRIYSEVYFVLPKMANLNRAIYIKVKDIVQNQTKM